MVYINTIMHMSQLFAFATSKLNRTRNSMHISQLHQTSSEFDKDYTKYQKVDDSDAKARSDFGTKWYWDSMYDGMGDFDSTEYSWYYGYEVIKPLLDSTKTSLDKSCSILIPGCGNDPLLLDLYNAGFKHLTAFDYSQGAIDRQHDLLEYLPTGSDIDDYLSVQDCRSLPEEWTQSFDVIIEKGALDAIYLSGDGNFEQSVKEFGRVLKEDGICISCSGVVPEDLRRERFSKDEWEWLRDGSDDLKAGSFVFKRR